MLGLRDDGIYPGNKLKDIVGTHVTWLLVFKEALKRVTFDATFNTNDPKVPWV
jgi:hypothetical protein